MGLAATGSDAEAAKPVQASSCSPCSTDYASPFPSDPISTPGLSQRTPSRASFPDCRQKWVSPLHRMCCRKTSRRILLFTKVRLSLLKRLLAPRRREPQSSGKISEQATVFCDLHYASPFKAICRFKRELLQGGIRSGIIQDVAYLSFNTRLSNCPW